MSRNLLLIFVLLAAGSSFAEREKPNVVLIYTDDLGWQDVKCYDVDEPTPHDTPNIDALAKKGVLFRQAYSPAPTCSPSRCAIMNGKHPARNQKTHVLGGKPPTPNKNSRDRLMPPWYRGSLPVEETTIAEALKANGYRTGHSGKWHIAIQHHAYPQPKDHGFDVTFAGRGVNSKMKPHRLGDFATDAANDPYRLNADGIPRDQVTVNAIQFMEESKEQPFFLYYATWLVHYPIQSRSKVLLKKYCEKIGAEFPTDPGGWPLEGQKNPYYGAMVEMLDAYIGQLVDYLEATDDPRRPGNKLADNTYVIFSSDNGGALGGAKESYTSNRPLDGGKSSAKEGGIRVPLIIAGPGIKKGVDSDVMVNGIDFYPTILSWTKTEKPEGVELDGSDLSTLLQTRPTDPALVKAPSGKVRNTVLHHFPHGNSPRSALRVGNYKLLYNYNHVGRETAKSPLQPELELYQLYGDDGDRVDIEEAKNLATDMPERAEEMKKQLLAELDAMKASPPYFNPQTSHWLPNKDKVCTALKAAREGNMVSLSYKENGAKVIKGFLMATQNGGETHEEWFRYDAAVNGDGTLSADLPEGTTHYLFNLVDEHNFLVSYPEVDDMGTMKKSKKSFSDYALQTGSGS